MQQEYIIGIIVIITIFIIVLFVLNKTTSSISPTPSTSSTQEIKDPPYPTLLPNCNYNINKAISYIKLNMNIGANGSVVFTITGIRTSGLIINPNSTLVITYNLSSGNNSVPQNNTIVNMLSFTITGNLINFITYTTDYTNTSTITLDTSTITSGGTVILNTVSIVYTQYNTFVNTQSPGSSFTNANITFNDGCNDKVIFNN